MNYCEGLTLTKNGGIDIQRYLKTQHKPDVL